MEAFEDGTDLEAPDDLKAWEEFMQNKRADKARTRKKSSSTDLEGCSISAGLSLSTGCPENPDDHYDRFQFVDSVADSGQTSENDSRDLTSPHPLAATSARRLQISKLLHDIYGSEENILDELDDTRDLVRRSSTSSTHSQGSLHSQRSSVVDYTIWRLEHFSALSQSLQRLGFQGNAKLDAETLQTLDVATMRTLACSYEKTIHSVSEYLVRELRRKDHRLQDTAKHCLVVSAILQLLTNKGDEPAKIRFSVTPPPDGYLQWIEAMRSVLQLPGGLPTAFRKTMWITIANRYINQLPIEWDKFKKLLLYDRLNPEEEALGMQIVKDLHRTGLDGFCGENNERERHLLKRVLVAYARFRPSVGYCQGFNIIAAVILDVVDKEEEEALKIMIYLIEHVLPPNFFANDLEALSIDLSVFQELVATFLPELSTHLDHLRILSLEERGANGGYEPPLTNLFTIQWFLTLFATCLAQEATLRVWDWYFLPVESAFDFYSAMQLMQQRILDSTLFGPEEIIRDIFNGPDFDLRALRVKHEDVPHDVRSAFKPLTTQDLKNSAQVSNAYQGLRPHRRRLFSLDKDQFSNKDRRNSSSDAEIDLLRLKKKYDDAVKASRNAKATSDNHASILNHLAQRRGSIFKSSVEIPVLPFPVVNPFVFPKLVVRKSAPTAGIDASTATNGGLTVESDHRARKRSLPPSSKVYSGLIRSTSDDVPPASPSARHP